MARTGFWFQSARGRAMVRNREMKRARRYQEMIGQQHGDRYISPRSSALRQLTDADLLRLISQCVRRARQANKDWVRYRKLAAEFD